MSSPTFFKFSYYDNMVRLETWTKYAFFPGVFVGEFGITGFLGVAVRGPWKKRIHYIENMLDKIAMQNTSYSIETMQGISNEFYDNINQVINDNDIFEGTGVLSNNQEESISAAFCTSCGKQISANALLCPFCGQIRSTASSQGTISQSSVSNTQSTNFINDTELPPVGCYVSRKEFINKYVQPSLRKNITNIAILCYVCSGLTFIVSCLTNPYGIIDALILGGLALGMHLAKSKVCAIIILVLSIIEAIYSLKVGSFPFWWLIAGISAVITFNKIDNQYKQFLNR